MLEQQEPSVAASLSPAEDLELPFLDLASRELAADPAKHFAAARQQHPWLARCGTGYVLTEYEAIKHIRSLDDSLGFPLEKHVSTMGAEGTGWARFIQRMMISRTGADHTNLRQSVAHAFTPRAINRLRDLMRAEVASLLAEWTQEDSFDFAAFAAQFPIRVMFGLIGGDKAAVASIQWALETQGSSFALDPSRMEVIERSYQTLWKFVDDLISTRGDAGGRGDLLDDLIAVHKAGTLDDEDLRIMLVFLFAAGYDTSKNLLTLIMHTMLERPDIWKRCAGDVDYCAKVVEEGLRFASPVSPMKMVETDIQYRGIRLKMGSVIVFPLSISGRDEGSFPNPDVFDPDREHQNRNIGFGRGKHICLGQFLARAQIEEGLALIAREIPAPRLAGEVQWRSFPSVWGIVSLPISLAS